MNQSTLQRRFEALAGADSPVPVNAALALYDELPAADLDERGGDWEGRCIPPRPPHAAHLPQLSCSVARPGRIVSARIRAVTKSSTIGVEPRPSFSGPSSQIDATAITGIVSPMLAIADPIARLKLVWMRPRRAARTAASDSG